MNFSLSLALVAVLWLLESLCNSAAAADSRSSLKPIQIVAAENFYGNIAQQIGGDSVVVTSIINNPNQDPHEFQPTAATAKAIADADIVINNGFGYDSWVDKLLATAGKSDRVVITVASFVKAEPRENPHFWYNPETVACLADKLAQILNKPAAAISFRKELKPLFVKIALLKTKYPELPVTATEPLFTPMAKLLGWKMLHEDYQWAIMNETEPSFQEVASFQESLKNRQVRLLLYNKQVANPSTHQLRSLAEKYDIPVVGVTESQPSIFQTYQAWMLSQLSSMEDALKK
jgi:zinc/manganese transport system substrate-binding protein